MDMGWIGHIRLYGLYGVDMGWIWGGYGLYRANTLYLAYMGSKWGPKMGQNRGPFLDPFLSHSGHCKAKTPQQPHMYMACRATWLKRGVQNRVPKWVKIGVQNDHIRIPRIQGYAGFSDKNGLFQPLSAIMAQKGVKIGVQNDPHSGTPVFRGPRI